MSTLLAWLGNTDLRAPESQDSAEQGPILNAAKAIPFEAVHLLSGHQASKSRAYSKWLAERSGVAVVVHTVKLTSPTSYEEIYRAAFQLVQSLRESSPGADLTYHLSPGTPAMAAIWLLLAKARFPARLIESSREEGVKEVDVPFELPAEFISTPDGVG